MNKPNVNFQQVVDALVDISRPFPPANLHKFSDISPEDLSLLNRSWASVPLERKISVLSDLEEIAESDTLVCFDDLGRFVLKNDKDPLVLTAAIRLLWECEDPRLIPAFMEKLSHPDGGLRAAAADALGIFIYLGEMEELPIDKQKKIEDVLLAIFAADPVISVKRKALESLGYSSRKEVIKLIQDAYQNQQAAWQASALVAMGRSADMRWKTYILENIRNDITEIQVEAIRAAGLLELADVRAILLDLLKQAFDLDLDVRSTAIWSLSQIGGKNVRKAIEKILKDADDEDEVLFIENALENLEFSESFPDLSIMNIESDELDTEDDLSSHFPGEEMDEEVYEDEVDESEEDEDDEEEVDEEDEIDEDDEDDGENDGEK